MVQRYTEGLTRERRVEEAASFDADIVAAIAELREEKRTDPPDDHSSTYLWGVANRLGVSERTVGNFLRGLA